MKVVALAGGVGGARLIDGLANCLLPDQFTAIVNTGDDFEHLGLKICPDLDTVCYTLAGLANPATGWGRADETWGCMEALAQLGGPIWFRLGDHDLATHLERTRRLREGYTLSQVMAEFCHSWGVEFNILPVSDDPISTWVYTIDEGMLTFQEYFVHRQCQPAVRGFRFEGVEHAHPAPGVLQAIQEADLVIISPSNPWVSIDPILAVPGVKGAAASRRVVAVSPIIGGQTVKGPAAKMCAELGITPSAFEIAKHYRDFLTGFVFDQVDEDQEVEIVGLGIRGLATNTLMKTDADRVRLAHTILEFGEGL
jgi:LPPG:FO 2-phospho-L-lactate transferase